MIGLVDFGGLPDPAGAEVAVFEAVAVASEAEDLGWWMSRSTIAVAAMSSPKIAQPLSPFVERVPKGVLQRRRAARRGSADQARGG